MAKSKAKGVVIKAALTATPTTLLSQEAEVGFNQGDRTLLDVTTHDSSVTKDYLDSGLRETAECEITCEYDPANTIHELIRAAAAAGTLVYLTMVLPDAGNAQWALSGIVLGFSLPPMTPGSSLKMSFKFKAIGADTFAA